MIDKERFKKSLSGLVTTKGISNNDAMNNAWYSIMKNDFDEEEFSQICADIYKNVEFFGKYPDPKVFYDRKPKIDMSVLMNESCNNFLCKIEDYLDKGIIPSDYKRKFLDNLTATEGKVLQSMGGISNLWTSHNRDSYSRSIDNILKEAREKFKEMYEVDKVNSGQPQLTYYNREKAEKVNKLISTSIKRIA